MKNTIFKTLITALIVLLALEQGSAQEVAIINKKEVVIDCSKILKNANEYLFDYAPHFLAEEIAQIDNFNYLISEYYDQSANNLAYAKFEVAPFDVASDGTLLQDGKREGMDWATAFKACRNYGGNPNEAWRLPTQRELMLMWIFRRALNVALPEIGGAPILGMKGMVNDPNVGYDTGLWSATVHHVRPTEAWVVGFSKKIWEDETYSIRPFSKADYKFPARCIREITPPGGWFP